MYKNKIGVVDIKGGFGNQLFQISFAKYLDTVKFNKPSLMVISNSYPSLCSDPSELKVRLKNQMCNGVRWRETMNLMAEEASENNLHIVEIGPSNVLGGLGKRHLKNVKISQVSNTDQIYY